MAPLELTPLEDKAWQGFLYLHDRLWRELEAELEGVGVSMAEYSVLALRGKAGRARMRMSELAQRTVMSTGAFGLLPAQLQHRGRVEPRRAGDDARGFVDVLPAAGRTPPRQAERPHG